MTIITKNKKASFQYTYIERYEAGLQLVGSEVKSIRNNECSINESSFCYFKDGELYIKGMHIAPYEHCGRILNHEVLREKKLLLHKKELHKLGRGLETKGQTIIPLKVYITEKGLIKLEIALCKGKNNFDKKMSIKEKDLDRDSNREIKGLI